MTTSRFVALLLLLGAASCYSESPAQSTIPTTPFADEQHYRSGPPGGAMDPEPRADAYGNPGFAAQPDDDEDEDAPAVAAAPGAADPGEGLVGPADPSADPGEGLVGPVDPSAVGPIGSVDPNAQAQVDPGQPTAGVTDVEINATLDGYGQWVETDDYGAVWRPDATVVGVDFTPYESGGSWAYTDSGWAFSSDYNWGWLPFHYGRWCWFEDSWGWVPGHRWSPAWVDWRHGSGVVGWRPRAPHPRRPGDVRDHRGGHHYGRGNLAHDGRRGQVHDAHWRFATERDFSRPHIRSHLYGNAAEGLRVTSRVNAPPVRARTMVRAGDVMRDRYSNPRTQQSYRPQRFQQPSGAPQRYQRPYSPGQTYQRPARTWNGPSQPTRTWNGPRPSAPSAPGRVWTSPNRPSSPPPSRNWGSPPARTSAPPSRYSSPPSAPIHTGGGTSTGSRNSSSSNGGHTGGGSSSSSRSSGGSSGGHSGGGSSGGGHSGGGSHSSGGHSGGSRGR